MLTLGLTAKEVTEVSAGPKRIAEAFSILLYASKKPRGVTCDECAAALGLTHGSSSPRFSELERAGCLSFQGARRITRSGGVARVCVVPSEADFHNYLKLRKVKSQKGLSGKDSAILEAGRKFLRNWKSRDLAPSAKSLRSLVLDLKKASGEN